MYSYLKLYKASLSSDVLININTILNFRLDACLIEYVFQIFMNQDSYKNR